MSIKKKKRVAFCGLSVIVDKCFSISLLANERLFQRLFGQLLFAGLGDSSLSQFLPASNIFFSSQQPPSRLLNPPIEVGPTDEARLDQESFRHKSLINF